MRKRVIGFFGGSFDPIHNGHIQLALSLIEKGKVDEVIFCPAGISPFKKSAPPLASKEDRLKMCKLAIAQISQFSLLDWEVKRKTPSYTIDTIRFLKKRDPKASYRLILGEDSFAGISKWKESDTLLKLAPPLVGSRLLSISSTEIRKRLKEGKYCGHLLPHKVLEYIHKHNLYTG